MMRHASTRLYGPIIAVALLGIGFCFATGHLRHALLVYLASWLFLLGVVVGSMTLLMIHALTGGEWGNRLADEWMGATRLFPFAALGALPLLFGMRVLFPWLQAVPVDDPYLGHQRWYLNATGLVIRTVVVFAIWAWVAYGLMRRHRSGVFVVSQRFAAAGVITMLLTITVVAVDWVMSLVPRWHSTDIALLLFTSQLLIAFAVAVLARGLRRAGQPAPPQLMRDFGNLMLVMVLGWAYISFIDYLTSWVADLPAETAWYAPRLLTGWWWLGVIVACLGWGLPFFTLLLRKAKSSRRVLGVVAAVSLFAQWLNLIWLVLPSGAIQGVTLHWTDPLICVGVLGFCALRYRAGLPASAAMEGRR